MGLTHFPNGVSSFGVPISGNGSGRTEGGSMFGITYFIDPANGSDGSRNGKSADKPFAGLQAALNVLKHNDTILCAPGDYSGNYSTPLNAVASFVSLIGVQATHMGAGPWAAPSNTAEPIIDVLARGWRISGFEFDAMTGAAAIRMTKIAGLTQRCDFFQVDSCLFSGGKTGIEFNGGGTYWTIEDNHFSLLSTAGGGAIFVGSSAFQVPALGLIRGNRFDNNVNHIYGGATRGFSDTVISGNNFQADGNDTNATILLDIRGSGGGNSVIGNFFDMANADFADTAVALVRANATDYGAGNHFKDGVQSEALSA